MGQAKPKPSAPSVSSKLLSVIDVFDDASTSLSLTEIAQRAGFPLPTTYRYVNEWVSWGALIRLPDGRYEVGTRLWEIGVKSPSLQRVRRAALPFMEEVLHVTGHAVQLAILEGTEALYVEKLAKPNSTATISSLGRRLPLHATGVGLILLAAASPDFVEEYLSQDLPRYTPFTVVSPSEIRKRLTDIKRLGVVRVDGELHASVISIASPVRNRSGATVAALSVVAPISDRTNKSLETVVRQAASSASRVLGYQTWR